MVIKDSGGARLTQNFIVSGQADVDTLPFMHKQAQENAAQHGFTVVSITPTRYKASRHHSKWEILRAMFPADGAHP